MGRKRLKLHRKFSAAEVAAICQGFLAIGEEVFRYVDQLAGAGFQAFNPRLRFTESFCETAEECALHRQCVIEHAKYLIGRPWPPLHIRWTTEECALLYTSSLLKRLCEERDKANGVPENQLGSRYPGWEAAWRREIDPCRRRQAISKAKERAAYEKGWAAVLEEEARLLQQEVTRHATDLTYAHVFDQSERYALFVAVMERDGGALGFSYDKLKSRPNYPIFSKAIGKDWDICWAIEDQNMFSWSPPEGRFTPFLEVRSRTLKGSINNAETGEFLHIRYAGIVPGFFNAYRTFRSLNELETMMKAHLYLYRLMAPTIEKELESILGSGDNATTQESGLE